MISHFESRLADLLGSRLAAPFAGRVDVEPGSGPADVPSITVAVVEARPLEPDFGSVRPEAAPGADDPRRVVRLDCDVHLSVRAASGQGRGQVVAALDALTYLLEDPGLRRSGTLDSPAEDPGFLLEALVVRTLRTAPEAGRPRVEVGALGWFWPPNTPGQAGVAIREAHIRHARLPVSLEPWPLLLRPGDPQVTFTVDVHAVGTMVVDGDGVTTAEVGEVALRVVDDGGRPGAGTLGGGSAGPDGTRIVTVEHGRSSVAYTPPDEPAVEHLVVSTVRPDTGDGPAVGPELARFSLVVAS
jgi:hypothetical protein